MLYMPLRNADNAGLHDCDTPEFVNATHYEANIRAIFETLKPAAHAVAFVTTTPYDISKAIPDGKDAGIHMPCVLSYNAIAKRVAGEVGAIIIDDLYQYVEDFCDVSLTPRTEPGNYSSCAVQSTGLHFYTNAPAPSGQQYTGIDVANTLVRALPVSSLAPPAEGDDTGYHLSAGASAAASPCGAAPSPLNKTVPNVLIIGDSISDTGSGYVSHTLNGFGVLMP
jgi:hypothetical protein